MSSWTTIVQNCRLCKIVSLLSEIMCMCGDWHSFPSPSVFGKYFSSGQLSVNKCVNSAVAKITTQFFRWETMHIDYRRILESLWILGWVNLYKKNLKLKNIQFVVNSFYKKKWKDIYKNFFLHNWHANLYGFANICMLPVSNTFKDMQSKI